MADPELRKNPAPIEGPMPMSWRCRPLRVREGCVSTGMLRESVASVIPLLPQITGIGLSVVSKAFVMPHFLLLLYLALSAQENFSCSREYIVTQERPNVFCPNCRNWCLDRHLESSNT